MITMAMDFDPQEILIKPLMAHLATGSPESPRDSPLWFLWEDGAVWLVGNSDDSFPARLLAEPRCAIGIVDFDIARGILRHVGIRGHADILAMDGARLLRLLERYLGPESAEWNTWFRTEIIQPLDLMIRITPASIVAREMSYFKTGPAIAKPVNPVSSGNGQL
ncbi:MAG: pyridoxamine 5'-phosphate oxidase [Parvibaculaceae bacterium]